MNTPRRRTVATLALCVSVVTVAAIGGLAAFGVTAPPGPAVGGPLVSVGPVAVPSRPEPPTQTVSVPEERVSAPLNVPADVEPATVDFFSDSIGFESVEFLRGELDSRGDQLGQYAGFPGAALCDFVDELADRATDSEVDIVAVQFLGNFIDRTCIESRVADFADEQALVDAYLDDITAVVKSFEQSSTQLVIVIGPEPVASSAYTRRIAEGYRRIAAERGVPVIDSTEGLRDAAGVVQPHLLCGPGEDCDDAGLVTVRSPDGIHLCPVSYQAGAVCPTHSPGASRFARAVSQGLTEIKVLLAVTLRG